MFLEKSNQYQKLKHSRNIIFFVKKGFYYFYSWIFFVCINNNKSSFYLVEWFHFLFIGLDKILGFYFPKKRQIRMHSEQGCAGGLAAPTQAFF